MRFHRKEAQEIQDLLRRAQEILSEGRTTFGKGFATDLRALVARATEGLQAGEVRWPGRASIATLERQLAAKKAASRMED